MYVEGAGKRLQLWIGLRCQVQLEAMDQLGWTALLHACRNDMTEARRLTWSEASKHVNDVVLHVSCHLSWGPSFCKLHPSIPSSGRRAAFTWPCRCRSQIHGWSGAMIIHFLPFLQDLVAFYHGIWVFPKIGVPPNHPF